MVNLLTWWYSTGWGVFANSVKTRLSNSLDYFSIGSLLRTLFSPFRQIDAGGHGWNAFTSRLISRFIGALVRLVILIMGTIALILQVVFGGLLLIVWPLIPLLPVVGIVLTCIGWVI